MQCLISGCSRDSKSRGLCVNCYQAAKRTVKKGTATWEALIAAGLAKQARDYHPNFDIALKRVLGRTAGQEVLMKTASGDPDAVPGIRTISPPDQAALQERVALEKGPQTILPPRESRAAEDQAAKPAGQPGPGIFEPDAQYAKRTGYSEADVNAGKYDHLAVIPLVPQGEPPVPEKQDGYSPQLRSFVQKQAASNDESPGPPEDQPSKADWIMGKALGLVPPTYEPRDCDVAPEQMEPPVELNTRGLPAAPPLDTPMPGPLAQRPCIEDKREQRIEANLDAAYQIVPTSPSTVEMVHAPPSEPPEPDKEERPSLPWERSANLPAE